MTVDTAAPGTPVLDPINATNPVTGTAEPGSTVGTVNDPTAKVVVTVDGVAYPAVNNGDGTWTLADNTLPGWWVKL
ncbi:hypothetical protein JRZ81_18450 [Acinetobacter nosocomialis]|nr:hypothetical protein [Acinetobacter nosocomialis]MBM9552858.1 hypothetical protein [Acinetobacter nosocomialis]